MRTLILVLALAVCDIRPSARPRPAFPLTKSDAAALVFSLPDIKVFCSTVEYDSHGTAHGVLMSESEDPGSWEFYVGEDHDDHTVGWNRFRVMRNTGEVFVSLDGGGVEPWTPLEQWRKRRREPPVFE